MRCTNNISGFTEFHYSLVISVCDCQVHMNGNEIQTNFIRLNGTGPSRSHGILKPVKVTYKKSVTLDLYTKTALIGRDDLSIDLLGLRLQDEQVSGCVDIYAVARLLESEGNVIPHTGKGGLYQLMNCWVKIVYSDADVETPSGEPLR